MALKVKHDSMYLHTALMTWIMLLSRTPGVITASLFISNDISSVILELFRKARRKQFQSGGQVSQFLRNRIAPSLKCFLRHYAEPKVKQGGGGFPVDNVLSKSITNLEARAPPPRLRACYDPEDYWCTNHVDPY